MRIFKKKTTQIIEERARKQQREIDQNLRLEDEKVYEENLRGHRNAHAKAMKKLEEDLKKQFIEKFNTLLMGKDNRIKKIIAEKDKIIKEITTEKNKKIEVLNEELTIKKEHIKDNQIAWMRITGAMPKLITAVAKFRVEKEVKALTAEYELSRAGSELGKASECEDDLESVERTFKKIGPMIQELLHMSDEDKNNHERFINGEQGKIE